MIFSTTALLVAVFGATPIGEAAYNAVVPKNSVGAAQLRKGAVTNAKLRGDAVTSGKVKNGSLRVIDFKPGQIPAGPAGPKGDKGDKGDKGEQGAPGATNVVVRWSSILTGPAFGGRQATCNAGEVAVGGGGGLTVNTGSTSAANLIDSKPVPNTDGGAPTGWHAGFNLTGAVSVAAYVICAKP